MRFSCHVKTVNRLSLSSGHQQPRSKQSTITIGGYGPYESGSSLYLLHQTAQDPAGVRYKITTDGIRKLSQKWQSRTYFAGLCHLIDGDTKICDSFVKQGRITVKLSKPMLDLLIAGRVSDIVKFASTMKNCTSKTDVPAKKLKLTNLETVPKKCDPMPQKDMVIDSSKKYRLTKSFPSSLETLKITNAELECIDPRIIRLQYLKDLKLQGNNLRSLPESIYLLYNLVTLDLSNNNFGQSIRADEWKWINSLSLCTSLKCLNLSYNKIRVLPDSICNLKTLTELNLSWNELHTLPNHLGFIRTLRILFLEHNQLRWLPISMTWLTYEYFDVTDNPLMDDPPTPPLETYEISLKAMAASVIVKHRMTANEMTLPRELIRLLERSCFCLCKTPTFPTEPSSFVMKKISTSNDHIMSWVAPMQQTMYCFGFRLCREMQRCLQCYAR